MDRAEPWPDPKQRDQTRWLTQIEALLPHVGLSPKLYAKAVREAVPPPGFGVWCTGGVMPPRPVQ